jgi:tRNA-Thr(GGU) m(6)t(6)A37 methyltransferase TsaA
MKTFEVKSIGHIHRDGTDIFVMIDEAYRPALRDLDHFSHVMVFFWSSQLDQPEMRKILQVDLPYAEGHKSGVFATRSPVRPNPILMTTCKILGVEESTGVVRVADLDAFDGTPVLDLKAYFPVCDRVQKADIPEWLQGWPEWMPEDGIGLEEYEK